MKDGTVIKYDCTPFVSPGTGWTRINTTVQIPAGAAYVIPTIASERVVGEDAGYILVANPYIARLNISQTYSGTNYNIKLNPMPELLKDGMVVYAMNFQTNTTTTPKLKIGVFNEATIVKPSGDPVDIGDIIEGSYSIYQYNKLTNTWMLMNPAKGIKNKFATLQETIDGLSNLSFVTPSSVKQVLSTLFNSPSGPLDSLMELSAALNDDPSAGSTLINELAKKAGLASPNNAFTGTPKAPTPITTDNSKKVSTTEFVKAAIALAAQANPTPAATTSAPGTVYYATPDEIAGKVNATKVITPHDLTGELDKYITIGDPIELPQSTTAPTQPKTDRSTSFSSTKFVQDVISSIPDATSSTLGVVKTASQADIDSQATGAIVITPEKLISETNKIKNLTPTASKTQVGKIELATDTEALAGTSESLGITPRQLYLATRNTVNSIVPFTANITGNTVVYYNVPFSLSLSATPVNGATSILSFSVSVKNLTDNTVTTETITAVNNQASWSPNYTQATFPAGGWQITVTAKDDLNKVSTGSRKTLSTSVLTVNTPVIVSPTNGSTGVSATVQLNVTGFGVKYPDGSAYANASHMKTKWKFIKTVSGVDTVVSTIESTTELLSYSVPFGTLEYNVSYKVEISFYDAVIGYGTPVTLSFTTIGFGTFTFLQKLHKKPTDYTTTHYIGKPAVSADGRKIAIANYGNAKPLTGDVTVYELENGVYVEKYTFRPVLDAETLALTSVACVFGKTLHMSDDGNRLFCSLSITSSAATNYTGKIYIYDFNGTEWINSHVISPNAKTADGAFPYNSSRMSGNGEVLVVPESTNLTQSAGTSLYLNIFTLDKTTNTWARTRISFSYAAISSNKIVDINYDGTEIILGNISPNGVKYYRRAPGTPTWTLVQTVTASNVGTTAQYFGTGVLMERSGTYTIIPDSGGVWYLMKNVNGVWTKVSSIDCSVTKLKSFFGATNVLDTTAYYYFRPYIGGNRVIPCHDSCTSSSGSARGAFFGMVIESDKLIITPGDYWTNDNLEEPNVTLTNGPYTGRYGEMSANGTIFVPVNNTSATTGGELVCAYVIGV